MANPTSPQRPTVAVIGGTGYGGAELIRLLSRHPLVDLVRVTSIDHVDEPLEHVHHNLGATGLRFEDVPPAEAVRSADIVFLALPHRVSATLAPVLPAPDAADGPLVIDLSGDFRLRDADAYARFYGAPHPHPEHLDGRWTYGLPELHRDAIGAARRVASPGCFATTIALGLIPLAHAGLLPSRARTVACTGSSGSGAYASAGTHHPLRANNLKIYKPLAHQHSPEIEQTVRDAARRAGHPARFHLDFVPVSAPLTRGILANSFASLPRETSDVDVAAAFADFYAGAPFVRLLAPDRGRSAEVVAVKGSMYAELSWTLGPVVEGARELLVTTAADNLVKGGAGQAVQSMNVACGFPEVTGLDAPALWP